MNDPMLVQAAGAPAPIAFFVHARPDHTARTLAGLAANPLAAQTPLFVFADAARHEKEAARVAEVRRIVHAAKGFRDVTVVERETNLGLAGSITGGLTDVIERFGRAIVVEDDLAVGPHFLDFMNAALNRYEHEPHVWHVNGWTYPVELSSTGGPFLTSIMECWGWATWADRWQHFRKDPHDLLARWPRERIDRFNIGGGYDSWADVKRNADGVMNTWAVFWYATIFENDGLCIAPPKSHVMNIGIDGSGTNSGSLDIFATVSTADTLDVNWPESKAEDEQAWQRIHAFMKSQRAPLWRRLASKLKWRLRRLKRRLQG